MFINIIKIDNYSIGLRIDKWIKSKIKKIPQSLIEKDLRKGKIKVNKKIKTNICLQNRKH